MNNVLILLDNPDDWKPYCETKSILTVSDYLKNKPVEKDRKLVINLSNDYSYGAQNETYIEGWEKKTSKLLIYKRLCKI